MDVPVESRVRAALSKLSKEELGRQNDSHLSAGDTTVRPTETVQPEKRRSYSQSHRMQGGRSIYLPTLWKMDDVAGKGYEQGYESVANLGLLALEVGEVEPHMFRQLALLCSVRHFATSRVQMAHPSALRSLISLLQMGSPRMQRWEC